MVPRLGTKRNRFLRKGERGRAEDSERTQQAVRSARFYSENLHEIGANFAERGLRHMFIHDGR